MPLLFQRWATEALDHYATTPPIYKFFKICPYYFRGGQLKELIHKNTVTLEGLLEDPMFTVVFSLFYEVGEAPKKQERRVR